MPSATTALIVIPIITPLGNRSPWLVVVLVTVGSSLSAVDGVGVKEVVLSPPSEPPEVVVIFPPEEAATFGAVVLLVILSLPEGVIIIFPLEEGATLEVLLVASTWVVSDAPPGFKKPNWGDHWYPPTSFPAVQINMIVKPSVESGKEDSGIHPA